MSAHWSLAERGADLARAERDGLDVLVVGGGITGAGVLRDLASRGLRALLVERDDFASGTSSRSSKLIHGGLRYIGEGHLGVTRQSCRERDRLQALNPHLVRPAPFLFPAYTDSHPSLWQVRAALWIYAALSNFRSSSRFRMLGPDEVSRLVPSLRREGLRGAGFFHDAQVDDVRLVLETLKSARSLGCAAVSHAEVVGFERGADGRIAAARIRDALGRRTLELRAHAFVNAAGPAVERVRGLDRPVERPELRPAKGVHLVIPRDRLPVDVAVTFEAADRRHLFASPWDDVVLIGTTDEFSDDIDEPVVTIGEVHYLLAAANAAFPGVALTTNDLRSVYAGVRPLVAGAAEDRPPSSVSREDRIYEDVSGLISAAGGKLTTYRATGEKIARRALRRLPAERRRAASRSRTAALPLRFDAFDRADLEAELHGRFGVAPWRAAYLVSTWGGDAETLLREAPAEQRRPIGDSRYSYAEIAWSLATECPATLCDLLERRLRTVLFSSGQGMRELAEIAQVAAETAGWDAERTRAETAAYAAAVRRRYQIAAPPAARSAA